MKRRYGFIFIILAIAIGTFFILGHDPDTPISEQTSQPPIGEVTPPLVVDTANTIEPTAVPQPTDTPQMTSVAAAEEPLNPPAQISLPDEPVPDQLIIQFDSATTQEERLSLIENAGGMIVSQVDALDTVVVNLPDNANADALLSSPLVTSSEPDYYVAAQQDAAPPVDDPLYPEQWALEVIGAPQAWAELPPDAPKVTVAVIDSGVCLDHQELEGRILADGYDFIDDDNIPQDEFGHGCAVAGIIAANSNNGIGIAGVAPNAMILPLRVLNESGIGTYSDVAAAIIYAADHGAEIINLSLGGYSPSDILIGAIDYAIAHDVIIVAAAGNTGGQVLWPAAYEPVIAVGSLDQNLRISRFSARGNSVDYYAPGEHIVGTDNDGIFRFVSGTSFASSILFTELPYLLSYDYTLILPYDNREQNIIVRFDTPTADYLTEEVRGQIIEYLSSRIITYLTTSVTYFIQNVHLEEEWIAVSVGIGSGEYDTSVFAYEVVEYLPESHFNIVLVKIDGSWVIGSELDENFSSILSELPRETFSEQTWSTLINEDGNIYSQNVPTYDNYKLPWPSETVWRRGNGYGDPGWHVPNNMALDFYRTDGPSGDIDILASAPGTVINICTDNSNGAHVLVRTLGTSEQIYYVHLDARTLQVELWEEIKQGDPLGRLLQIGPNGYKDNCGSASPNFTHLHFVFPRKPLRFVSGYEFTDIYTYKDTDLISTQHIDSTTEWDFSSPNGLQGWQNELGLTDPEYDNVGVNPETQIMPTAGYHFEVTSSDPQFISPIFNVSADEFQYITIEMASQVDICGGIYFQREGDSGFSPDRLMPFQVNPNGGDYRYEIQMTRHPLWSGNITRIRIDPGLQAYTGVTGTERVWYSDEMLTQCNGILPSIPNGIRIQQIALATSVPAWDFAQNSANWTITGDTRDVAQADGGTVIQITGGDAQMISPPLASIYAEDFQYLMIDMAWAVSNTVNASNPSAVTHDCIEIFYQQPFDNDFTQEKSFIVHIDWHLHDKNVKFIPLNWPSSVSQITGLRVDPTSNSCGGATQTIQGGGIRIDRIHLATDTPNWDFSGNNGAQGWYIANGMAQETQYDTGMWYRIFSSEYNGRTVGDPYIVSPFLNNLQARRYPYLMVRMSSDIYADNVAVNADCLEFYYTRRGDSSTQVWDTNFSEEQVVRFHDVQPGIGTTYTYYITLHQSNRWWLQGGYLQQIRLDPSACIHDAQLSGGIRLDEIALTSDFPVCIRADLDRDNDIDINDASLLLNLFFYREYDELVDINFDRGIDIWEIQALANIILSCK